MGSASRGALAEYNMITTQNEQPILEQAQSAPKAGWILFAVCILGAMIQIDFTAVNVALIAISKSVHADLSTVQWALSAYILAWGAFLLTAGRCADLYGKRRTFLTGTSLFMIGSALTGAATQPWFLILGRVVQGLGGALFLPGLYTLVFTSFPENRRGYALGVLTSSIAIGLAIGPTFGGVVLHLLNWRWIFFLNLPLGFPVLGIILWAVKREPWKLSQENMDFTGAFLIALALTILMYTLNQVNTWGIHSSYFWFGIIISLLLLSVFIWFERRQTYPLIQLAMFRNTVFLGCSIGYIFMGFNFATVLIIIGLFLENAQNYSALNTGFIFLIMTAMFAWLSVYSGKLIDRIDPRVPIVSGWAVTMASFIVFLFCNQQSPIWIPLLGLALFGMGGGLGFPALNTVMMKSVPNQLLGSASSAFSMFGCVGNAIGLILSSVIIIDFGGMKLGSIISQTEWRQLDHTHVQILKTVIGTPHYTAEQLSQFNSHDIPALLDILRTCFVHGMGISMLVCFILATIGLISSWMMIRPEKLPK